MSLCQSGENGLHRWVFASNDNRADHYICANANCGETLVQFDDGER